MALLIQAQLPRAIQHEAQTHAAALPAAIRKPFMEVTAHSTGLASGLHAASLLPALSSALSSRIDQAISSVFASGFADCVRLTVALLSAILVIAFACALAAKPPVPDQKARTGLTQGRRQARSADVRGRSVDYWIRAAQPASLLLLPLLVYQAAQVKRNVPASPPLRVGKAR